VTKTIANFGIEWQVQVFLVLALVTNGNFYYILDCQYTDN